MHKITLFPLGNADCCLIDLECGKKILFDFANTRDPGDKWDLRCNLPELLRSDLGNSERDAYDVVAFTHLDRDHFAGFSEFFYLEHAKKYQAADRVKMTVMWVPADLITESQSAVDDDEGRILQEEARHRFKNGAGIRVFSRPEHLKQWCKDNGVDFEARRHLITDAGQVVPDLSLADDGVEFFAHSPFAVRQNETTVSDRNGNALVMQATFLVGEVQTKALFLSDCECEALANIVDITVGKKNQERLVWDIAKLPHHCSYGSLGPEQGRDKTEPMKQVASLYAERGQDRAIMVSTSNPIPVKGSSEDNDQPPHRQAAAYYKAAAEELDGQFVVTMEHPRKSAPRPTVIEIDENKATLKKKTESAGCAAVSQSTPRAG